MATIIYSSLLALLVLTCSAFGQVEARRNQIQQPVSGGGGGPFVPIAGYAAWWNPSAGVSQSGIYVTNWTDQSANAYPLGWSGNANEGPTISYVNGNPMMTVTGNQILTNAGLNFNQPIEMFFAASNAQPAIDEVFIGNVSGSLFLAQFYDVDGFRLYAGNTIAGAVQLPSEVTIVHIIANGGSSAVYTNGVLCCSGNAGTDGLTGMQLFGFEGSTGVKGLLGHVVIYTSGVPLSAANVAWNDTNIGAAYGRTLTQ